SGAEETLEYMAFPVFTWGFKNVANLGVVYESFLNEGEYRTKTLKRISESAHDFYEAITKPRSKPTFRELMFFNVMKRKVTLHRQMLPQDYNYWKEVGWLERVFYYEDDIPVFKGMLARLLATIRVRQVTKKYGLDVSLN
ncbi:hypothetical protein KA005_56585, partial [bacterium]|nr:hypothetical protein [bacterium]